MLKVNKKSCIRCGKFTTYNNFPRYKDRKGNIAYTNVCKECKAIDKNRHYLDNKEMYLARSKAHREKDHIAYKKYLNKYYRDNKEILLSKQKDYYKTEKGKEVRARCKKNYFKKDSNRIKHNARKKLLRAIQSGKIIRPNKCELCSKKTFVEGHHEDYNKPLEVRWLCKTCHENVHHLNEGH